MAYKTESGYWVRDPDRPPSPRRQISVRLPEDLLERVERLALDLTGRPPFVNVSTSDLVRRGLELVLLEGAPPVERTKKRCLWTIVGDRSLCSTCGAKGTRDEEGTCLDD